MRCDWLLQYKGEYVMERDISCKVNQTERGREHSDDNVPSDKPG